MYRGNDNRIVRIKDESLDKFIHDYAQIYNAPYQVVFECVVSAMIQGYVFGSSRFDTEVSAQLYFQMERVTGCHE